MVFSPQAAQSIGQAVNKYSEENTPAKRRERERKQQLAELQIQQAQNEVDSFAENQQIKRDQNKRTNEAHESQQELADKRIDEINAKLQAVTDDKYKNLFAQNIYLYGKDAINTEQFNRRNLDLYNKSIDEGFTGADPDILPPVIKDITGDSRDLAVLREVYPDKTFEELRDSGLLDSKRIATINGKDYLVDVNDMYGVLNVPVLEELLDLQIKANKSKAEQKEFKVDELTENYNAISNELFNKDYPDATPEQQVEVVKEFNKRKAEANKKEKEFKVDELTENYNAIANELFKVDYQDATPEQQVEVVKEFNRRKAEANNKNKTLTSKDKDNQAYAVELFGSEAVFDSLPPEQQSIVNKLSNMTTENAIGVLNKIKKNKISSEELTNSLINKYYQQARKENENLSDMDKFAEALYIVDSPELFDEETIKRAESVIQARTLGDSATLSLTRAYLNAEKEAKKYPKGSPEYQKNVNIAFRTLPVSEQRKLINMLEDVQGFTIASEGVLTGDSNITNTGVTGIADFVISFIDKYTAGVLSKEASIIANTEIFKTFLGSILQGSDLSNKDLESLRADIFDKAAQEGINVAKMLAPLKIAKAQVDLQRKIGRGFLVEGLGLDVLEYRLGKIIEKGEAFLGFSSTPSTNKNNNNNNNISNIDLGGNINSNINTNTNSNTNTNTNTNTNSNNYDYIKDSTITPYQIKVLQTLQSQKPDAVDWNNPEQVKKLAQEIGEQ